MSCAVSFAGIADVIDFGLVQHLRKLTVTNEKERVLEIGLEELTPAWRERWIGKRKKVARVSNPCSCVLARPLSFAVYRESTGSENPCHCFLPLFAQCVGIVVGGPSTSHGSKPRIAWFGGAARRACRGYR